MDMNEKGREGAWMFLFPLPLSGWRKNVILCGLTDGAPFHIFPKLFWRDSSVGRAEDS